MLYKVHRSKRDSQNTIIYMHKNWVPATDTKLLLEQGGIKHEKDSDEIQVNYNLKEIFTWELADSTVSSRMKMSIGPGEVAQQLQALVALAEYLCLVPSTQTVAHNCL